MKQTRRFYLFYLGFVLIVLVGLVWFLPNQPLLITFWILLHLFFLIYLFPQVLKLPKIGLPSVVNPLTQLMDESTLIKTIFQALDPYILIIQADGQIIQFTPPWLKVFSQVNTLTLTQLRSAPKLWSTINQGLATEKGAQFQWDIDQRFFQSTMTPLVYQNQFIGLMVTAFDITKVTQLEKIQSDFLADITHEIKTPLSAILGASEILTQSKRKLTLKETKEFQSMIASETTRLKRLINELTDLSRIGTHGFQSLIKTSFPLLNLMLEVKKVYQLELDTKQLNLQLNIPESQQIFVDRDKFFLIFSNLLSNAIRYTDHGNITFDVEVKKQNLIIYFTDSGRGIEPQNLERIFDRFYRTDAARNRESGGTGLGLAITRAIVQAHQGTIEVTSKLGKGTTFTLTIPHLT